MSAFDDLLAAGFGMILEATNAPTITHAGITRRCVSTPVTKSKAMTDTGYWIEFNCVAELLRSDFTVMQITDRSRVLYEDAGATLKLHLKVMLIEDDPADATVKLTLKIDPA